MMYESENKYTDIIQVMKQSIRHPDGRNIMMRIVDMMIKDRTINGIDISDLVSLIYSNGKEDYTEMIEKKFHYGQIKYVFSDGCYDIIYLLKKISVDEYGSYIVYPSETLRNSIEMLINIYGLEMVNIIKKLNTVYSVRLYYFLYDKEFMKTKYCSVNFYEIKELLGLGENEYYNTWGEFKRKVLDKCIRDINEAAGTAYLAYMEDKSGKNIIFEEG